MSSAATQPMRQSLPGLPKGALSPEKQLEALQRVQNQAEQRVRLGLQLFKAAEAHTLGYRELLDDLKAEREKMRDELAQDVTRSLRDYDQWIGQLDETYSQAMLTLEARVNALESKIDAEQQKLQAMLQQTEKLLEQSSKLLEQQD